MGIKLYCLSSPERSLDTFLAPSAELGGMPWFNVPVFLDRETNIHPPKRSLAQRIEESREWLDELSCVEGLPKLAADEDVSKIFEVGGDSSGASYYVSGESRKCYVWWHDPDEIELVCDGLNQFLDWMIERQPEHPDGCSWTTFTEIGWDLAPHCVALAHADRYPVKRLAEKAKQTGAFELTHMAESVVHLLRPARGQFIGMAHDLRGFRTKLDIEISKPAHLALPEVERWQQFVEWLKTEGFCHPDTPSVRGLDDDLLE